MQILRTIFWVTIAVLLVIFSMANWQSVDISFWPGLIVATKLPLVVIGAFLLGAVPMWVMFRASRWSLHRRLDTSERSLADLRAMAARPTDPVLVPTDPAPLSPTTAPRPEIL